MRARTLILGLLLNATACGGAASASGPANSKMSLRGSIDARPFEARSAVGKIREDNGRLDLVISERDRPIAQACERFLERDDRDRLVIVQMAWPLAPGTVLHAMSARELAKQQTPARESVLVELWAHRDGSTARALGTLTVSEASPTGGTLTLDVATGGDEANQGAGAIRGAVPFALCAAH